MWRDLVAFLSALLTASAPAAELQGFSFDYQITGDRSIAPFQVFDDGTSTFLQFHDPSKIPAIFVRDDKGSRLASTESQGNYLRIAGVVQRLELVSERKTAAVVSMRKVPAPQPAVLAQVGYVPETSKARSSALDDGAVQVRLEALRQSLDALAEQVRRASAFPEPRPAADVQHAGPLFALDVRPGERLSEAIRRFVASQKLELDWDTGGADFEIRYGFRVVGGSLEEVLFAVLSPFKLNAVTRRGNGVVAVSRAA